MPSASAREIAEAYDIPVELMAKVLQRLVRRGLLSSHQGTRGGYRLSRPASMISVADIIQAIDGPLTVTACSTEAENCGQYSKCSIRDPLWRIKDRIVAALATCSLQEMSADAPLEDVGVAARVHGVETLVTSRPVYLDYHATTPVDPRVLEAMLPYFSEEFGNPASRQHAYGWKAEEAVENAARRRSRRLIGASPREIVFTSGATESNNLALKGCADALRARGDHIVTVATEHKSVLDSCKRLEAQGWRVTRLGVERDGLLDLDALRGCRHRQDRARLGDGRQQRDRRAPADGRDRAHRPRGRGAAAHRRRAGGRQGADRRRPSPASICCR